MTAHASIARPIPPAPPRAAAPALRERVIRGSAWTLGAFAVGQALRLGSNVVLAAWLAPAVFGLMNLINVLLQGVQMFSDVGIGPSIVQSRRGEDPAFLRTAWTLQAVRGFGLWGLAAALAWPMAAIYDEPSLLALIPVAGLAAAVMGFNSTALFTLNRRLHIERLAGLDLTSQVLGLAVMLTWAYLTRDIWALVGGLIVGAAIRMLISHAINPGPADRLGWDRAAAAELLRFGRWILLSTAITFLADRAYQLVAGAQMTLDQFGVFSIALLFPLAVHQAVGRLTQSVVFPAYSRLAREPGRRLDGALVRTQAGVLAIALPPLVAMVVLGPHIVRLLYRPDFHDAGWMMQILAAGQLAAAINAGTLPILLARGDSFRHMAVLAAKFVFLLVGMGVGLAVGGVPGLIVGIAAANLVNYPVVVWAVRRYNAWVPWLDAVAFAAAAASIAAGLWITGQLP